MLATHDPHASSVVNPSATQSRPSTPSTQPTLRPLTLAHIPNILELIPFPLPLVLQHPRIHSRIITLHLQRCLGRDCIKNKMIIAVWAVLIPRVLSATIHVFTSILSLSPHALPSPLVHHHLPSAKPPPCSSHRAPRATTLRPTCSSTLDPSDITPPRP